MTKPSPQIDVFTGQFLVAMPSMPDPRFQRAVVYMCAHSAEGAMGLIINQRLNDMTLKGLLPQLQIESTDRTRDIVVQFGGPVEPSRGFVLHSQDYIAEGSMVLEDGLALTATVDILRAIAEGRGPKDAMLALGYAGWDAGQLDAEIHSNGWLHVKADPAIIFDTRLDRKWERSLQLMGIDPAMLSAEIGRA
jgi:putative transcriptional regulator